MHAQELARRAAWRAGASEELADRFIEAFLHELGDALARGETVRLRGLGTFAGTSFRPASGSATSTGAPLAETIGYEAARAPRDA